jgi:predicted DCC family thiol-disulfide oxidoreductase YuxK
MPAPPQFPLRVFYDGSCKVCAGEIEHYRRRDQAGRLVSIDISTTDFDPSSCGIPLPALMYELHVIDRQGTIYRGVDAFWAIWQAFPAAPLFKLLGRLVTLPLLRPLARLGYRGFARIRPYLPKHRSACPTGSCRIGRK